uniref:SKP1 component POZ domain-containing protein n=1 Tax=Solanum lycopersicum TaxID=4081 RepID=A0A3Q7ECW7_SOLLC
MSSKNLITLKTSNDMRSQVIKNIVQYVDCASNLIPLTNVDGKIMFKVVEYWKKHSEEGVSNDALIDFDKNLVKVDQSVLF